MFGLVRETSALQDELNGELLEEKWDLYSAVGGFGATLIEDLYLDCFQVPLAPCAVPNESKSMSSSKERTLSERRKTIIEYMNACTREHDNIVRNITTAFLHVPQVREHALGHHR